MTTEQRQVNRKQRTGVVVSQHGEKTVIVSIERASRHRLYRKVIRRTKRYHVHDEDNAATNGDLVRIEECRPISRTKHWRLVEVLTEREVADVAPESIDESLVSDVQRSAARASAEEADTAAPATAEASSETAVEATDEAAGTDEASDQSNDEPEAADDAADGDVEKQAE
ncbi:MAG TPA: 30S ribosomal protein S17 [Dehalococcoidia bacterium]|jgi:small subunit ribosomal protein S17|nr:30S ribosomal protein S17 [Dehalococcoidia bacterium]